MKTLRYTGIALLFFLSASAFIGSIPMLAHPHGEPWNMPQGLLQHSPFASFFLPGIILLLVNGLLAGAVVWMAVARLPRYPHWMILQGGILFGWLVVECIMIRLVVWPHYLYGAVAAALIILGLVLARYREQSKSAHVSVPFGDSI